jgi:hypothetical protein
VHLGDPDARSDLRLGQVAVEAKSQHPRRSRSGNRAGAHPQRVMSVDGVVPGILGAEQVAERSVALAPT